MYQDALAAQLADSGRGEERFLLFNLLVSPLPFHDLQVRRRSSASGTGENRGRRR